MDTLRIGVKNFGPLGEAMIELKPLTIFVGPNNSGKSYMAQLFYVLSQVRKETLEYAEYLPSPYPESIRSRRYGLVTAFRTNDDKDASTLDGRTLNAFKRLLPDNLYELITKPLHLRRSKVSFDLLPQRMKDSIQSYLMDNLDIFEILLARELERCYDAKLSGLVCKLEEYTGFSLNIEHKKPLLMLSFGSKGNKLKLSARDFSLQGETIQIYLPRIMVHREAEGEPSESIQKRILERIAIHTINNAFTNIINVFPRRSFYLPAARSGILHGQKAIARVGFRTMQRAGIESISIPKFPGVVIDFLDAIYSIDKDEHGDFHQLARDLEKQLTPGRIEFVEGKQEAPEIYFREPKVGRIGLHRTSSMISELAPIILLLRYLVNKGETVIIEEPESHMHPGAQREIAKILVKLVKRGAKILITTHSDYLLQQISNLVALSSKPDSQKQKLGYTEDDLISPHEVGAYLFERPSYERASNVRELTVGENGILEEEFGNIAEALYHETIEAKRIHEKVSVSDSQR